MGYNKITNLAHNFGQGEAKSEENSFENGLKLQFSQFCCQFLGYEDRIGHQKSVRGVLMCEGQIGEIPLQSPGKLGLFLVLALFLYPSLPKIGHSRPLKNHFSE